MPSPTRLPYLVDLVTFVGTVIAAFLLDWQTRELVWGLWLPSLIVGYGLILYGLPMGMRGQIARAEGSSTPAWARTIGLAASAVGTLFMVAFFTVHFGGFHLVHGVFLNTFFPITPPGNHEPFDYLRYLTRAMAFGWPLVLGSLVSARGAFVKAGQGFNPMGIYGNVVRMHLLIFVFAFAAAAELDQRWLYVVVLFFYFFPLRALKHLLTDR
jgi:Family of unknown function (DUF6498)